MRTFRLLTIAAAAAAIASLSPRVASAQAPVSESPMTLRELRERNAAISARLPQQVKPGLRFEASEVREKNGQTILASVFTLDTVSDSMLTPAKIAGFKASLAPTLLKEACGYPWSSRYFRADMAFEFEYLTMEKHPFASFLIRKIDCGG